LIEAYRYSAHMQAFACLSQNTLKESLSTL
jgi:hypothetical protein